MRRATFLLGSLLAGCADDRFVIGSYEPNGAGCEPPYRAALFCSGFEQEFDAGTAAFAVSAGATLERSSMAHRGTGALRARTQAAMSYAFTSVALPSLQTGDVHFRVYVYVPSGFATEIMNVFFLGSEPGPDPFLGIDFNVEDGQVQLFSPQFTPARRFGRRVVPRDRWFCYRAAVQLSDTAGRVQLYLDDELALDASDLDTVPPDGVREFRAGIDWSSQQSSPFEILLDDLVVDRRPIGCD